MQHPGVVHNRQVTHPAVLRPKRRVLRPHLGQAGLGQTQADWQLRKFSELALASLLERKTAWRSVRAGNAKLSCRKVVESLHQWGTREADATAPTTADCPAPAPTRQRRSSGRRYGSSSLLPAGNSLEGLEREREPEDVSDGSRGQGLRNDVVPPSSSFSNVSVSGPRELAITTWMSF